MKQLLLVLVITQLSVLGKAQQLKNGPLAFIGHVNYGSPPVINTKQASSRNFAVDPVMSMWPGNFFMPEVPMFQQPQFVIPSVQMRVSVPPAFLGPQPTQPPPPTTTTTTTTTTTPAPTTTTTTPKPLVTNPPVVAIACQTKTYFVPQDQAPFFQCCGAQIFNWRIQYCVWNEGLDGDSDQFSMPRSPSLENNCDAVHTCCSGSPPIYDPEHIFRCCPGSGPYNPAVERCSAKTN